MSQVVTTVPAFPTEPGPVSIYFHADEGTKGLQGYTGDVYAHTGIVTSRSTPTSLWRYVVSSWDMNDARFRMTRVDTDVYRLDIPNIRTFYEITDPTEKILQFAFVFRSGVKVGGSYLEGKDVGGKDIFVDLYDLELNVAFVEPSSNPLYPLLLPPNGQQNLRVEAVNPLGSISAIELFKNGVSVASTAGVDTLEYLFEVEDPGKTVFVAQATDSFGGSSTDTLTAYVNPSTVDMPVPSGMKDGVNYHEDPGTVTLVLQAPDKLNVYALGDFNNWEPSPDGFLKRHFISPTNVRWWVTLTGLTPGVPYRFQYLVDGEIRIGDPYAELVLDPIHDAEIDATTYPDMPVYPHGKAEYMVTVFETGQPEFNWEATDYVRPAKDDLVIYELLIRDFIGKHNYQTLTDTLSYLERLGINAIELMPFYEFDGNKSWGYEPAFLFAPDKYYGTKDALKRFIDECHKRGIAVIMDAVLNHMTGQSPFVRLYNSGGYSDPTPDNPWLNPFPMHPFNVFNDVNHESERTHEVVDAFTRHWLEEFRIDGFRLDLSKGFTQRYTTDIAFWGTYDAGRIATLKRLSDKIWEVDSTAYIMFEHFSEAPEEFELAHYRVDEGLPGMMLWNNMNGAYSEATMGYHSGGRSNLSGTWYKTRGWTEANTISFMESHDEQWVMFKNLTYGASAGDYDVKDLHVALERMKMAGAFFFTVPGPRMMWQFGELGYGGGVDCLRPGDSSFGDCPAGTPYRTAPKAIHWEYQNDPLRDKLYRTWASLIHLRKAEPVFRDPATSVLMNVSGAVKRIEMAHPTMKVVIVGNFDVVPRSTAADFPETGKWYSYFEADSVDVTDTAMQINLLPGQFFIFTNRRLDSPPADLITVANEQTAEIPKTFLLSQNYPNPFNPETHISFVLPENAPVKLEVFDLLGRRIETLVDGWKLAGTHLVTFDAATLSTGTYLYRLSSGNHIETRKMTLLK